jgi:ABC-type sugar transport system, periplasmic component
MRKNRIPQTLALALALATVLSATGFARGTVRTAAQSTQKVTLKLFSNLPDRTSDQGLLEQTLINNYEAKNKNVTIQIEALQDDPYKQKFKAYLASNNLPDVYNVWGQPSFFDSVMKNGYAAALNPNDYKNYKFLKNSLDGFSYNGKLYGLPRNSDFMVLYYNKKIFKDNGLSVPTKVGDFAADAKKLKAKGLALIAVGGKEKWPLAIMYNDIALKQTGSDKVVTDAFSKKNFNSAALLKAATEFQSLCKAGIFETSYITDDTGTAKNLFAQGKTAMFYSGEWDMGMASSPDLSAAFKNDLAVTAFPQIAGGKGKATDIMAWHGGGYAVNAHSTQKAEAIKFLNYIFEEDNWSKIGWQKGLVFPSQTFSQYLTGKENPVQKGLVKILNGATSNSGTTINDRGSATFKSDCENAIQELAANMMTPQQFISALSASVKKP